MQRRRSSDHHSNHPSFTTSGLAGHQDTRVLRSTFQRAHETLICDLRSAEHGRYQIHVLGAALPSAVESFPDAMCAFRRQADIERGLLLEGWTLASVESRCDAAAGLAID
jgi:hypothetical protein